MLDVNAATHAPRPGRKITLSTTFSAKPEIQNTIAARGNPLPAKCPERIVTIP